MLFHYCQLVIKDFEFVFPNLGCPGLEPGTNRLKAEYSTN